MPGSRHRSTLEARIDRSEPVSDATDGGPRGSAGTGLARGLVLAGAALIAVSAFLPGYTRTGEPGTTSLWEDGTGWPLVGLALVLAVITLRGAGRTRWSWAGLVVGGLAGLDALSLVADDGLASLKAGVFVLALGALLACAGWALGFARERPAIAGIGPWTGALGVVRRAQPAPAPAPAPERTPGERGWRLLSSPAVWSLAAYGLVSLVYFAWPVRHSFGSALIAENVLDPSAFVWFYEWWPHAIVHGDNPFISHAIFAPEGYNLTWVTAVPGPSLLLAPVTLALGPIVTFNVIALLGPALAAWSAFLLCRHVTGQVFPALVGGYVFGFSPHILRAMEGSPTLYLVALVPALALLVLLRLEGRISERALIVAVAVVVLLEFSTSLDVLATMTIFGAVALAAAAVFLVDLRALIVRTAGVVAAGYVLAGVLVSPFVFFMVFHEHTTPEQNSPFLANDLMSWFRPDSSLVVATSHGTDAASRQFGGLAYFGIPLLIVVALYLWENRRRRTGWLLAACFLVPTLAGLGHRLIFDGDITRIGTPWSLVDRLPGLELLIPQRFPLYAFLAAAVMVALWLSSRGSLARWAVALLALAFMVPNVRGDFWNQPVSTPAFFSTDLHRQYLDEDDNVITVPIIGDNMRWQAEAEFDFRIAGGGVGAFPESFTRYPAFNTLISSQLTPDYRAQLRRFIADKGVTAVVLDKGTASPTWLKLFGSLGVRPVDTGGVLLYRLNR